MTILHIFLFLSIALNVDLCAHIRYMSGGAKIRESEWQWWLLDSDVDMTTPPPAGYRSEEHSYGNR